MIGAENMATGEFWLMGSSFSELTHFWSNKALIKLPQIFQGVWEWATVSWVLGGLLLNFYPFINTFTHMLHHGLCSYQMHVEEMITVMIKLIEDNVNTVTGFHVCFVVN